VTRHNPRLERRTTSSSWPGRGGRRPLNRRPLDRYVMSHRSRFSLRFVLGIGLIARTAVSGEPEVRECWNRESHALARECFEESSRRSEEALAAELKTVRETVKTWDEEERYRNEAMSRVERSAAAFRKFRREQCDLEAASTAGGNAAGDLRAACESELNRREIARLRALRARFEGREFGNPNE